MKRPPDKDTKTFTDFLRKVFKNILEGIAVFFIRSGLTPNMVTAIGLVGNIAAGLLIAWGELLIGGILAMVVGPLDAIDGVMARIQNETDSYGAFIDSVSDRYSELVLYGGLMVYYLMGAAPQKMLLVFAAVVGSLMVSYVRARAEALDFSAKIGLMTRAERYIVLIPGIIIGYPHISLWILAILSNFTALQRIWCVHKQNINISAQTTKKKEKSHE